MPIDREKALAATFPEGRGSYDPDDVILYHLGIGAGVPPTDPRELEYTYEKHLKVLPSFAVVVNAGGAANLLKVPGLQFNPATLLHGEQDLELHQPLPTATRVKGRTRIADLFDKGKAALLILESAVRDESDRPLFTSRMALFLRGEGGFGGPPGPKAEHEAPGRKPDGVIERTTLSQQALLYRLCGDKNPLHADPEFAKLGGYDRPIIHGLCSYGVVCKAIVDAALGGDVTRVARYQARFSGVGFPGETYVISYWKQGQKLLIEAASKERGAKIISHAAITLRG